MKVLVIAAMLIGVIPSVARAQGAGISVDVSLGAPPGEAVSSVDVFYDQLSPYGVFVDDGRYGRVFIPEQTDFVPYTVGHWEYTDLGFVWISTEPFSWPTSHYG